MQTKAMGLKMGSMGGVVRRKLVLFFSGLHLASG
jgi:hypothetical protein